MQNKPGWLAGWALGLMMLCACGGSAEDAAPGPGAGDAAVGNSDPARILLVFAVHGLRSGELDPELVPNLVRLSSQGMRFTEHVIQSTGSQSEMSTLLTGRGPLEHGVGSVHENGLSALADGERTLAEFLGEQGWATLASMALPQFGPEISGLHQGFDSYSVPDVLGDSLRRSDRVEMVSRSDWETALAGDKPVFAWVHNADGLRPGLEPSEGVMSAVKDQLKALLPKYPGLQQSVDQVDNGPDKFEEVRRAVLRSRGSEVHGAFMRGVYQGQLVDLDKMVGRYMNLLNDSGRASEAIVALVSTQGARSDLKAGQGSAVFPSEVIRTPLWLWSPGRIAAGEDSRMLSSRYVADLLCDQFGLQFGDQHPDEPVVSVWDAGFGRQAFVTKGLHVEENAAAGWLGFDADGRAVTRAQGLDEEQLAHWDSLQAATEQAPVRFGYELNFDCAESVTVRWRVVEGRARGATIEPPASGELSRVTPMTGVATLKGKGTLRLETYAREAPVVWSVQDLKASAEIDQAVLQLVQKPYGPEPEQGETLGDVAIHRDAGVWTRVLIQGEAERPVRVFAGLVPKKQNATRRPIKMEWTAGFDDQVERLAGRDDAVLLTGKTPLNVQFKELPGHTLCIAVQVQDRWLSSHDLSYEGKFLTPSGQRNVYTPSWWPGVTESLVEEGGMHLGTGLTLRRFGPLPREHKTLSRDASFFVGRLGRGE